MNFGTPESCQGQVLTRKQAEHRRWARSQLVEFVGRAWWLGVHLSEWRQRVQ
jgi:hypothetical protein